MARPAEQDRAAAGVSHVYPLGSRVNERGRLEIGGCDLIELAEKFGTPAYVYAEDDIRTRAREYKGAFESRTDRFEVVYASKAFPCTAVYRLLMEEGLDLGGLHAHLGSQVFDLEPFERLAEVLVGIGDYPLLNLGGGLGIAYTADQKPPAVDEYVETLLRGAPEGVTVLCEPGRSLV